MAKGKYQEWLTEDGLLILKGWARDGLTDIEIAKKIGISQDTFYRWVSRFHEFSEAIKKGRRPVLVDVEDSFFETKLKGHYVEEETMEKTVHKDAKGKITGSTEHRRVTKRYIPADTTAQIFFMKCRMPEKYNDKLNVSLEAKNEGKLADLIEGLKVNAEDDIHEETVAVDEAMANKQPEEN